MPAVIRNVKYVDLNKRKISFSKKHVFLRDDMRCVYCGAQDITGEILTFDHVIPKAKWKRLGFPGTATKWENIVTACRRCNLKKADKTPKEAGMKLLKEPKQPSSAQYVLGISPWTKIPKQWEIYMPPLYKHLKKEK